MKLATYNRTNCTGSFKEKAPAVHFFSKGKVTFNTSAIKKYGLTPGSKIEFHQDQDNPGNWYFTTSKADQAFKLRAGKGKEQRALTFDSAMLASRYLQSLVIAMSGSKPLWSATQH